VNDNIDYGAPAELFPATGARHSGVAYHRFETLGEAVRFAMEELPPKYIPGAVIFTTLVAESLLDLRTAPVRTHKRFVDRAGLFWTSPD